MRNSALVTLSAFAALCLFYSGRVPFVPINAKTAGALRGGETPCSRSAPNGSDDCSRCRVLATEDGDILGWRWCDSSTCGGGCEADTEYYCYTCFQYSEPTSCGGTLWYCDGPYNDCWCFGPDSVDLGQCDISYNGAYETWWPEGRCDGSGDCPWGET